jgi:hypothetical protein
MRTDDSRGSRGKSVTIQVGTPRRGVQGRTATPDASARRPYLNPPEQLRKSSRGNGAGRKRVQARIGHQRRQMCNSVTMCNGSKSHNPLIINMCNGVTGVPHLTWMPPMTRMGRLRLCGGLRFKANPTQPCHPWYPWSDADPLGQEWLLRHPPPLATSPCH